MSQHCNETKGLARIAQELHEDLNDGEVIENKDLLKNKRELTKYKLSLKHTIYLVLKITR